MTGNGRSLALLAAASLFVGLTLMPSMASPVAAADGIELTAETTYAVQPDEARVAVTIDAAFTNVTPDTDERRFYYTGYSFGLHPEATDVRATVDGEPAGVTVERGADQVDLSVDFGRQLFEGQSVELRVDYALPDGGPRSPSDVRVGEAFIAFYVYAYGEERADVRVELPAGFAITAAEGERLLRSRESDGEPGLLILEARDVGDANDWWAWIAADRRDSMRTERLEVAVGDGSRDIDLHAWPEDAEWLVTVRDRLDGGLPVLGELIGLDWPFTGALAVHEVHSPLLGGYAGFYHEGGRRIELTEELDDQVILHEAAHTWFNGHLFDDRWINEGLADEYASLALAGLGESDYAPGAVSLEDQTAFDLNAWEPPVFIDDDDIEAREDWGYDASWHVVREIVSEVGTARMREVFAAVESGEIAYSGEGGPERVPYLQTMGGWRSLLDLLEERAGSRRAGPLFEAWVVTEAEADELQVREDVRAQYAELLAESGGWSAPYPLRLELAQWRFPRAMVLIDQAYSIMITRHKVEGLAGQLELTAPDGLEAVYEGALHDLGSPERLATEQLETLDVLQRARRAILDKRDPLVELGLVGAQPDRFLERARDAFEAGDLVAARRDALLAHGILDAAAERGGERLIFGLGASGVTLAALGGGLYLLMLGRRRRRTA